MEVCCEKDRFIQLCRGSDVHYTHPVDSKTAVFSERTGVGVNLEGGRGEIERTSFFSLVGDLKVY